jgi:hypothetical protein
MTYNQTSARIKSDRPVFPTAEETTSPEQNGTPPPAVPAAVGRSDFASSAAMVNDILAAGPTIDAEHELPAAAVRPQEPNDSSEPTAGGASGTATSADFFASAKPKHPFWHLELSFRRSRKGSHSERRRPLPDA